MSANDPRSAPRRRKLVLRKIAESPERTPPAGRTPESGPRTRVAAPPTSYAGPVPTLRSHPQGPSPTTGRPSLELPLEPESARTLGAPAAVRAERLGARVEPEPEVMEPEPETEREGEELEPEAEVLAGNRWAPREREAVDWRSRDTGAVAAITPAAPSGGEPSVRVAKPAWSVPVQTPARPSVAPVVASLPPAGATPPLAPVGRARLSADSKLLAAGGALAGAMLLAAAGVLLWQHSSSPDALSPAAGGQRPVVVETRAPTAVALPPASTAVEARPSLPARPAAKSEAPAT